MRLKDRHRLHVNSGPPPQPTRGDERWTTNVRAHTHRFSPELGPAALARYEEESPLIQTLSTTESACGVEKNTAQPLTHYWFTSKTESWSAGLRQNMPNANPKRSKERSDTYTDTA
jgi:hypothetical protein